MNKKERQRKLSGEDKHPKKNMFEPYIPEQIEEKELRKERIKRNRQKHIKDRLEKHSKFKDEGHPGINQNYKTKRVRNDEN